MQAPTSFSPNAHHSPPSAEALEKAEALAEQGEVDQAQLLQQQAETYNKQHDEMFKRFTTPEKFMLVCDICGVFINSTDNEQRRRVRIDCGAYRGSMLHNVLYYAARHARNGHLGYAVQARAWACTRIGVGGLP